MEIAAWLAMIWTSACSTEVKGLTSFLAIVSAPTRRRGDSSGMISTDLGE